MLRQANGNDRWLGGPAVLVATSAWIGKDIPNPTDTALRQILNVTRYDPEGELDLHWINDPLPRGFKKLGVIAPTAEERKMKCRLLCGWESCPTKLQLQWRWEHDRKALRADEAVEAKQEAEELKARNRAISHNRSSVTLEQLSKRCFFASWKQFPPKDVTRACRSIMKKTVQVLSEFGPSASKVTRKAVLKECIEEFNKLDRTMKRFIETSERDDICLEFDLIAHACGLGEYENLADEWRDW